MVFRGEGMVSIKGCLTYALWGCFLMIFYIIGYFRVLGMKGGEMDGSERRGLKWTQSVGVVVL